MTNVPAGLSPGQRLGPYEIVAPLGAGGMGEVYRAIDSRLKRAVAIKVLPASLKNDEERLARFQREAELLAALNHPNIAQVYGVEHADGEHALVMELADGPTLADQIAQGALPLQDALPIARQIIDALDAAHERGIIHRDLKPANIKVGVDGTVKVLDFGLAKAADPGSAIGSGAGGLGPDTATITSPALTAMGMILGTAAYMSPEQAKGRAVDRRADIWAFGCVLYEMLTGKRAFGGEDITDTLANVLKSEVNLRELPASIPPRVRQVITACLQKDPKQRLASAQDVRLALDGAFDTDAPQPIGAAVTAVRSPWYRVAPYVIGALVAGVAVAALAWRLSPVTPPAIVSRFDFDLPEGQNLRNIGRQLVAIAPDGRSFVYNADGGLRIRTMGDLEARIVPGTEAPLTGPVYSPDSQQIAFYSDDQLKRVSVGGGAPTPIATRIANPLGMYWADDGTILLSGRGGIARVPETGGTPEVVVAAAAPDEFMAMPQLLPGGDAILFTLATTTGEGVWDRAQIVVHSLRTGQRTVVLPIGRDARYLPTGHLAYVVEDTLFAVAFDPVTNKVSGAPVSVVQGMWWRNAPAANWSVSTNGTLIYLPGIPADALRPVWVRRDGGVGRIDQLPGGLTPRLSRDAKQVLLEVGGDIWIYDLATGRRSRLTSDGKSGRPAWHPSGAQVAFSSSRSGSEEVWVAPADGTGEARLLTDLPGAAHVDSWSPDGKTLAFHHHAPGDKPNEILTIAPADPAARPQPLVQREFNAESAVFSPDGSYVAYISSESGDREIYIQPFPGPGPRVPVSVGGGREPVWAQNGELFYRNPSGDRMMVVKVVTSPTLSVGTPSLLFEGAFFMQPAGGSPRPQFDVTIDGQQLFMLQLDRTARAQIVVVQSWFDELKRLLPAK